MSLLATYSTPWKGINTSVPSNHIDASEAAVSQNFTYYEGQLQQPSYTLFLDTPPDGNPIEAEYFFRDQFNVLHQGVITKANLYEVLTGGSYGTAFPLPAVGTSQTNIQVFENRLFFVNGSQYVLYFDGTTLLQATNLYGAKYIFELASSIVIANTVESGGQFLQRVRWCVAGNFTQWDPTVYIGAGFEDLLDCPDGITGVMNTSPVAYIVRDNGITQMIPTGIGTSAFNFNHLWASEKGIGDVLGTTVTNFGAVGFAVSSDDVYILTASSYERIGGKVKNVLYKEILTSVFSTGWVEPLISRGSPYLRYRIALTAGTFTTVWSFSTETYTWEYEILTGMVITGRPGYMQTSATSPIIYNYPVIPIKNGTTFQVLMSREPASANTGQIFFTGLYNFKTESDAQDRTITVLQVKVRYQYQGNPAGSGVPVTVVVNGMFGNSVPQTLILADPSKSKAYYGGMPAPSVSGEYYNAYFSVPLTDQEYQVSLSVAPPLTDNQPSIRISDVKVFGTVGKDIPR